MRKQYERFTIAQEKFLAAPSRRARRGRRWLYRDYPRTKIDYYDVMPFFYHPVLNLLFEGVDSEDKYKGVVNDAMHTLATIVSLASRLRVVDQIRSLSQ
ncbi:hypothetical protein MMC28_008310, partial [Mycoblastus sanguinarius]|nr:hypothetical protein [Mycoblastus sanguinarius]